MIPAYKSPAFTSWFARDAERRIRTAFDGVYVRGLAGLRDALARGPLLVVTNHTAWWDPLVSLMVGVRLLGADAYALMDAKNLERLPFFGRVGAFGVTLGDPADGARAIRYAAKLLVAPVSTQGPRATRAPNRLVWIFAQGREVPVTVRPLGFRAGAGEVARVARRAAVVAGALRYEMGSAPRPALWASFDAAEGGATATTESLEARVTTELDRIEGALGGNDEGFEPVQAPRGDATFSLAQTALSWIARPRALR